MDAEQLRQCVIALGVHLTEEQIDAFQRFEDALYEANEVINLTRVAQVDCWQRHFLDSLLFLDLIPQNAKILDIGTGPGFPAWPLACTRPDLQVTALDSNGKMLGFLQTQPLPNLRVVNSRAEEWAEREAFDVVTGRAVAPLPAQLEISAAFASIGGHVVSMRTASDAESIETINLQPLGLRFVQMVERGLPGTDATRLFPIYEKSHPTQKGYPRPWAEIKRKPL